MRAFLRALLTLVDGQLFRNICKVFAVAFAFGGLASLAMVDWEHWYMSLLGFLCLEGGALGLAILGLEEGAQNDRAQN